MLASFKKLAVLAFMLPTSVDAGVIRGLQHESSGGADIDKTDVTSRGILNMVSLLKTVELLDKLEAETGKTGHHLTKRSPLGKELILKKAALPLLKKALKAGVIIGTGVDLLAILAILIH